MKIKMPTLKLSALLFSLTLLLFLPGCPYGEGSTYGTNTVVPETQNL